MNVLKKRFIPCLLVCALALTMIVPAFAATSKYGTVLDGQYVEAVIDVVVPTAGQVYINPYALPVKLDALMNGATNNATPASVTSASDGEVRPGGSATAGSIKDQQIVTEPLFIKNRSEVNLTVSATVTATLNSTAPDASGKSTKLTSMNYVQQALESTDTGKNVFAYLQMKVADDLNDESTAGQLVETFTGWTDSSYHSNKDLVVNTSKNGSSLKNMAVLKAGAESSTPGELEATNGSIAMFRITGQVVTEPSKPWDAAVDTFRITVAFTFSPDPIKATLKASPNSKIIEATNGSIQLTASLTGLPTNDGETITTVTSKLTSVTWAVAEDPTNAKVDISGQSGTTNNICVVKPKTGTNADNDTYTIVATLTADNGITYTASYTVEIKIP